MELNGALSNPRAALQVSRLFGRWAGLVERAAIHPRVPRPAPVGVPRVTAVVMSVLSTAPGPMGVHDVHVAAEFLAGVPIRHKSVKAALAAGTCGVEPRFERARRGVYRLTGADKLLP